MLIYKSDDNLKGPFEFEEPSFLLCPPFNISADKPNNPWMVDLAETNQAKIDVDKAVKEWKVLNSHISSKFLTYLLPNKSDLPDQIYVANLGIVLPHLSRRTVIISNYSSEPRIKEAQVGIDFFKMLNFDVYQSPHKFEGEADLKYLHDNVYIGGHGIRSELKTYKWMEENFDMKVIPLKMEDEYLYHLDCMVFPINKQVVLMCTELVNKKTIKEIEKYVEIVDVDNDLAYQGISNSVRVGNEILQSSILSGLKKNDENYSEEIRKHATLEKIASKYGLEAKFFDLFEASKSGALLSCCCMHLNYVDFN